VEMTAEVVAVEIVEVVVEVAAVTAEVVVELAAVTAEVAAVAVVVTAEAVEAAADVVKSPGFWMEKFPSLNTNIGQAF